MSPSGIDANMWGTDPAYDQMADSIFHEAASGSGHGSYHPPAHMMAGLVGGGGAMAMSPGSVGVGAQPPMHSDTLAMWSSAPSGFE